MYIHRAGHIRKPKKGSKNQRGGFRGHVSGWEGKFGVAHKGKTVWSDQRDTGGCGVITGGERVSSEGDVNVLKSHSSADCTTNLLTSTSTFRKGEFFGM